VNNDMFFKRIIFVLIFLPVILLMSYQAWALDEVNMLFDWVPNTNHTGFYVALHEGWFEEEGLKVNFIQPSSNMSVEQLVAVGRADFGISFQEWVTSARVTDVPIVSVAAIIQHNTTGFAFLAKEGINRPEEFTGKTYGGWGLPIEEEILKSLINGDGGDFSKLKFVNICKGDLLTMLQTGKIDIVWIYYGWDGIQALMRGLDLNIIMMEDYQEFVPDYYTPVIISSEEYINNNPDIVYRFMRAVTRGYNYAIDNPDSSAEILLKYTPESDSELIKRSQAWLSTRYRDDAPFWGWQNYKVWKDFGEWMFNRGLVEDEFDANSAFTNNFLSGE
jgi:ABC-type nitrate/sulfonate/bicarbonate transport system substrate-binding protein